MNKVIMMGRMVADAGLNTTPNGVPACKFRIAVDRNYQKKGEERKADFFNCVAYRGTAEFISKWFPKGRMILIEGEMQTSQYTDKNGNQAYWYEILVDNVFFTGDKPANSGNNGGNYGPPISEPPAGYGGYGNSGSGEGYSSAPPQSEPTSSDSSSASPSAGFSSAASDDYPF